MKLILACDPNGGIGYKNKLPWSKIQGDLPRFKTLTTCETVVMGHNTWKSLPKKPLPNRYNFVITSSVSKLNANTEFTTLENFLKLSKGILDRTWIIGGAKLVDSCWNHITEIHLTKTFTEYTCDTSISLLELENNFVMESSELFSDHCYQIWKRK